MTREVAAVRKIYMSRGTKILIVVVVILVLFGSAMLASGKSAGEIFKAFWDKFSDLLTGHIS